MLFIYHSSSSIVTTYERQTPTLSLRHTKSKSQSPYIISRTVVRADVNVTTLSSTVPQSATVVLNKPSTSTS
nr:MAG TPA: hypothetical protein [Bacteriophage sp.]